MGLSDVRVPPAPIRVVVVDVLVFPHWITRAPVTHRTVCGDVVGELEDDINKFESVDEPVGDSPEADACSHRRACDCHRGVGVSIVFGGRNNRVRETVFICGG